MTDTVPVDMNVHPTPCAETTIPEIFSVFGVFSGKKSSAFSAEKFPCFNRRTLAAAFEAVGGHFGFVGCGLYKGTPAVRVRELKPAEIENLSYSARHYVKVKNDYM